MVEPKYKVGDSVKIAYPVVNHQEYLKGVVSTVEQVLCVGEHTVIYCLEDVHQQYTNDHQLLWLEYELAPVCIDGEYIKHES